MQKLSILIKLYILILLALLSTSCTNRTVKPACNCDDNTPTVAVIEAQKNTEIIKPNELKIAEYSLLKPISWRNAEILLDDNTVEAWGAWLQSCQGLKNKPKWQAVCQTASIINQPNDADVNRYFVQNFDVFQASNVDGSETGLITGYYVPKMRGSRTKTAQFSQPVYREPTDLITVELSELYPDLKYKRVRGKLQGNKLVPYLQRADIDSANTPLAGNEIAWVADAVELFFLQIQGSGIIELENGQQLPIGYANQNGHAYNSIGKILIERGELTRDQASMQGIKNWALKNPQKLQELLNTNPSYVFFRELPAGLPGPLGALGVPITAERSVAIDPKFVPLGAPIFLSTTEPNSNKPLQRLMMAQDTGGAIKGGVRADFYWGAGDVAGAKAGSMKQAGKVWVLLPKGFFN